MARPLGAALEAGGTAYLPPSVVTIGRFVAGLSPREDFEIVRGKLRRRGGEFMGAGLVVLPKE